MKVSFDAASDFNAEYALPGYGCVVKVDVVNGIVNLSVEDEDSYYDEELDEVDDDEDMILDEYDFFMNNAIAQFGEAECDSIEREFGGIAYNDEDNEEEDDEDCSHERDYTLTDETVKVDEPKIQISKFAQCCNDECKCNKTVETVGATEEYNASNEKESLEYKLAKIINKVDEDGKILEMIENFMNNYKVQKASAKAAELFDKFSKTFKDIVKSEI